jgi:PAS domain S-box-containing protein
MSKPVSKKGGFNKQNLATLQLHVESRVATVVAAAPCVICAFKMPSEGVLRFNFCSPRVEEIFALPPRELERDGSPVLKLIHEEDQARVLRTLQESAENLSVWQVEFRVVNPYKGEIWVEGHALARRDLDGAVLWHGYLTDITSRKQAEKERRQSEALSRAAFESTAEGLLVVSEAGRIVRANRRFRELWRLPEGIIESGNDELVVAHLLEELAEPKAFVEKAHRLYGTNEESLDFLRFKDGRVYERFSRPLVIEQERVGRLWSFRDVTEQERASEALRQIELNLVSQENQGRQESKLSQRQRMEAIGQLAGGVAHDFNNLLTVIVRNTELLSKALEPTPERQELTQQIAGAARRASNLTRQLLAFSRRQVMQMQRLDLNELLAGLYKKVYRALGQQIALGCNYAPELAAIEADPVMLEQVMTNLALNAREAMPKGGQLTITTRTELVNTAAVARNPEAREGGFVVLTVTDTGRGMDKMSLERVFEPFFTTKEVGKGTGLGLATVYGIVKQHNGWLEVTSEVGKGTTFRIFFPSAARVVRKRIEEKSANLDQHAANLISARRSHEDGVKAYFLKTAPTPGESR